MRKISTPQQDLMKSSIEGNVEVITSNLEKIISNRWTELSPVSDTVKRLKRKGHRAEAEQYLVYDERQTNQSVGDSVDIEIIEDVATSLPKNINKIVKEGIVGEDNMISSNFLHKGSQTSRSVGRISNKVDREALGTGFLISPNLIMTNNHVIPNRESAKNCIIEFDFFADYSGNEISPNEFDLDPDKFFLSSEENVFDFSIIAVNPRNDNNPSIDQFGWIRLIEDTGKAHIGERLNIIHHPQGKPQHVSIRKNLLITHQESKVYLKYMTDTAPGSSGSPVFNDQWELVALHRASEVIQNETQKELYFQAMKQLDEDVAVDKMEKDVVINFGVRISVIANHIKSQLPQFDLNKRKLLQEIFTAINPGFSTTEITNKQNFDTSDEFELDDRSMNININIGNTNRLASDKQSVNRPNSIHADRSELDKVQLEIFTNKVNSQKSVFKALSFLEESRAKPYIPSEEFQSTSRLEYYGGIIADIDRSRITKAELYEQLHSLLSSTLKLVDKFPEASNHLESLLSANHLDSVSLEGGGVAYAKARAHLYTWVDLQEDRMLKGVYTQASISPEQLLLKDLIQALKIDGVEMPKRFRNNQYLNCEHIVPKSLFDNHPLGFSDLHHLITAEGATNTFRNNRPFRQFEATVGEVGPSSLISYIGKGGKIDGNFFEPLNNKALVARATLYFIICHKGRLSKETYDQAAIKTLIEWSNTQKPTTYELHRNESIYQLQGNRNPLIDFPNWVDKIDYMVGIS